jgi:iron complex outermembrane receptor protein
MLRLCRASSAAAVIVLEICSLAFAEDDITLPTVTVTEPARQPAPAGDTQNDIAPPPSDDASSADTPPIKERYQLPQTSASITAAEIGEKINAVDSADTIKYFPSLFVRKRNYGDNQEVLATRNWGIAYSARSLVYADDILLTPLISNNNTTGAPRWGMVSPEQIERVDFLYGPYAAAYPGNSMGGVLLFTTKMPDKPVFTFKQTGAVQPFDLYKTKDTYTTSQTNATFGDKVGDSVSYFFSGNFQNSYSQPLAIVTSTSGTGVPPGTSGAIPGLSRTGTTQTVLGVGGLMHTQATNLTGKVAVDLNDWLTATYTLGFWANNQNSSVQSYLRDANGNPTYGGNAAGANGAGFATNNYTLDQQNLANSLSLKTNTRGMFDWDFNVTHFHYLKDIQRNPFTVAATGLNFIDTGRITRLDGTNWTTGDWKGIWRPTGVGGAHEVSFGVHNDLYELKNPTYKTDTWNGGPDSTNELYSNAAGKTQTLGLWMQDAWHFAPLYKLTLGGRWENWRAFDGFNLTTTTNAQSGAITGTTSLNQPTLSSEKFSPKASLAYEPNKEWLATASFGVANRFPTVTELYQQVTVGVNLVNPNPDLKPETAYSGELALERKFNDGKVRLSLFQDITHDILVSQTSFSQAANTNTTFITNVDKVRNRGVEFAWQKNNVFIKRLEAFGSVTYVDSVILSDPTFIGTNGSTAEGKHVPYVPAWRTTLGFTYRPDDHWSFTAAGRYQSKIYATLDNIDTVPHVWQAFDPFIVADLRAQYKVSERGSIDFGVDNLTNEKYYLFHPFPQRTYVLQGRLKF